MRPIELHAIALIFAILSVAIDNDAGFIAWAIIFAAANIISAIERAAGEKR